MGVGAGSFEWWRSRARRRRRICIWDQLNDPFIIPRPHIVRIDRQKRNGAARCTEVLYVCLSRKSRREYASAANGRDGSLRAEAEGARRGARARPGGPTRDADGRTAGHQQRQRLTQQNKPGNELAARHLKRTTRLHLASTPPTPSSCWQPLTHLRKRSSTSSGVGLDVVVECTSLLLFELLFELLLVAWSGGGDLRHLRSHLVGGG